MTVTPDDQHCLVEQCGPVLIVTMNRSEAKNALSGPMLAGMTAAWNHVDDDPDIRVAILTGAGGAFCAGADLKAMTSSHPGDAARSMDLSVIESLLKGRRLTKPLIAAVAGPSQGFDLRGRAGAHRRRHGEPPGHRHPGRRRERPVRRQRAAVGAVPPR